MPQANLCLENIIMPQANLCLENIIRYFWGWTEKLDDCTLFFLGPEHVIISSQLVQLNFSICAVT
jgi:hypothetical protein